jgi:hypothetical protein
MTSQRCTRRSLPNYLVMTSYHWNVRQNILTLVNERQNNVTSCTNCLYLISTFIPLDVDKFGAVFVFHIFSLFNLPFFHILPIFSLFNLLFFCIFQIFSLFNLLFFCIFQIFSLFNLLFFVSYSLTYTTHSMIFPT